MEKLERQAFEEAISDLLAAPPVLLIQGKEETEFGKNDFDLIDYFSQDDRFAQLLTNIKSYAKLTIS